MTNVLIVEDDAWQREHLEQIITQAGYHVRVSPHALQAMTLVDDARPDVILLDMLLPSSNGIALLHELQSHADLSAIPVIIVSAETNLKLEELKPYGVQAVLDKSTMHPRDVLAAIKKAVL